MADAPDIRTAQASRLLRVTYFTLVALIAVLSFFNIWMALGIHRFPKVYHDMMGDNPLPPRTMFVLTYGFAFIALSFIPPLVAIFCVFRRANAKLCSLLAITALIPFAELIVLIFSLITPLITYPI